MSYAHTKRRKLIKKFKKMYPKEWYSKFRAKIEADVKERMGTPIRLTDLLNIEANP